MPNCVLCRLEVTDPTTVRDVPNVGIVCEHCLKAVTASLHGYFYPNIIVAPKEHVYFKVRYLAFDTVVDSRDCPDKDKAFEYARTNRLQSWYYRDDILEYIQTVTVLTRSEYCDWLRL
jgi:hypothetical protein